MHLLDLGQDLGASARLNRSFALCNARYGIGVNATLGGLMNTPMAIETIARERGVPRESPVPARSLPAAEADAAAGKRGAEVLCVTVGEGAGLVGKKDALGSLRATSSIVRCG